MTPIINRRNLLVGLLLSIIILLATACDAQSDADEQAIIGSEQNVGQVLEQSLDNLAPPSDESSELDYTDVGVGFTEDGHPYWGDPHAPIIIEEYSDYLCPFCKMYVDQTLPILFEKYGKTGDIQYVFRDFPIASLHPTAHFGHSAALCAAEQGADEYWIMHDKLFQNQEQWSNLPDPSNYLGELAESIGLDMATYQECIETGQVQPVVEQNIATGLNYGFNGTPTFRFEVRDSGDTYTLVGAQPVDTFTQWLDALVAGEAPPWEDQAEAEPPELPYWANVEGLTPDPERPGFTLAGDQYKGNPDAKLVMVEFSDFQCPACQRHALETQPTLDETFVDPGKIMWVYKHFPLEEHPQSLAAAAAAECAADQGTFWEMNHALFEKQEQWAVDDPDPQLLRLAEDLDIDLETFAACLNSRESLERVVQDIYDAQGLVQSTPTFIGVYGGKGAVFRGARSSEEFVTLLENLLEEAEKEETQETP